MVGAKASKNPDGRGKGKKRYSRKQLSIIKDAKSRGLSRRAILKQYPNESFTEGGIASALRRVSRSGHAAPEQRKRKRAVRAPTKVDRARELIDGDCSLSIGDVSQKSTRRRVAQ